MSKTPFLRAVMNIPSLNNNTQNNTSRLPNNAYARTNTIFTLAFAKGSIKIDMSNSHYQKVIHSLVQGKTTYRCQNNLSRYDFDIINNIWKTSGGLQSNIYYMQSIRQLDECLGSLEQYLYNYSNDRNIQSDKIIALNRDIEELKISYQELLIEHIIPFLELWVDKASFKEQLTIFENLSQKNIWTSRLEKKRRTALYKYCQYELPLGIFHKIDQYIWYDPIPELYNEYSANIISVWHLKRIFLTFDKVNNRAIHAIEQGMVQGIIVSHQQIMDLNFPMIIKSIVNWLPNLIHTLEFSIRASFPEPEIGIIHPSLQIWEMTHYKKKRL